MEGLTLGNDLIQEYIESLNMYWLYSTAEECRIQNSFCEVTHERVATFGNHEERTGLKHAASPWH